MKRILATILLLCGMALGQNTGGGGGGTARKLVQNAGDPTCSVAGQVVYDITNDVTKICNNALSPVTLRTSVSGVTNVANSLPANQVIVGNTYPDIKTTNCTVGVVATDAIYCPGGFYPASLAQDGTAVLSKGVIQSGANLVLAGTSQTTPTWPAVLVPDASHVYIQTSGQFSLVSSGATTAGHYVLASASAAGSFDDSATCPAGAWYLGTWITSNVGAGTYAVNLSPGWCPGGSVVAGIMTYQTVSLAANSSATYFLGQTGTWTSTSTNPSGQLDRPMPFAGTAAKVWVDGHTTVQATCTVTVNVLNGTAGTGSTAVTFSPSTAEFTNSNTGTLTFAAGDTLRISLVTPSTCAPTISSMVVNIRFTGVN